MTQPIEVLLIEDRPEDAELCMSELRRNHLANHIEWLSDGDRAMEYLAGDHPAPRLVLLDLKLPKVSGLDVLRSIRETTSMRSTPVVVMTSSKEDSDVASAYELGANSYIVKPVSFVELSDVLVNIGTYWLRINQPPTEAQPDT